MNSIRTIGLILAVLLFAAIPAWGSSVSPRTSLASEMIRVAYARLTQEPLTRPAMDGSILLARQAAALDPNSVTLWNLVLDLALLAERDDLKDDAIENLLRLQPDHEVARWLRLMAVLDRRQTFEQRVEAQQRLLREENIERLGPAVASRLALDLALLYQRFGDVEQFSRWLARAASLDSSNRAAAAMATGFFRLNVADPVGEAELLVNLLLADPTDLTTQVALAQLLLEHGAFTAAERMYRFAVRSSQVNQQAPATNLIADFALAQWARGDVGAALETVRRRQHEIESMFRYQLQQAYPDLKLEDIRRAPAPLDPTLAMVAAVIRGSVNDPGAAEAARAAVDATRIMIRAAREVAAANPDVPQAQIDPAAMAKAHLEMAWLAVWLGEAEEAREFIAIAEEFQPLHPAARDRYEGWIALRQGDAERAIDLLEPVASADVAARLGLATAFQQQGRSRDAGREFLAVARAQPGTLIGVWAAVKLQEMLGRRAPLTSEAAALERVIASIPSQVDQAVLDTTMALTMRLVPEKLNFGPYEPIYVRIEITNNSRYPLALDRDGPIRPQVLMHCSVRATGAHGAPDPQPFVVNIGRRFRIMPRETISVRVNLREQRPGDLITATVLNGSIIRVRGILNFIFTPMGAAEPALYGMEAEAPLIRVDGARLSEEWLEETVALLESPAGADALERMAMLSRIVAPRIPFELPSQQRQALERARRVLAEAFARLDAEAQAWLVAVLPRGPAAAVEGMQPLHDLARRSEHPLVQFTQLAYHSTGPDDPMIDAARRSEDEALRQLAELIVLEHQQAAAAQNAPR